MRSLGLLSELNQKQHKAVRNRPNREVAINQWILYVLPAK